ncbi:hypothetical protein BM86_15150 [Bacillus thuringiensis]|uniref:Uncharacterized protein n=1 Tax=Bacillus thuringiensis TaxID=1428 RepID=A0A9W3SHA9_BACTU|nr:hypothetical protein BT246_58510 [Bacillus thuringiensis]MBG9617374.1 hypothetical protein [Bacillus cereus]MBH0336780.1 hypothetical protein [Bacillus thuringiensis]
MFFKRKEKKNEKVAQSNLKRNNERAHNDVLIHTAASSVINSSSDYSGYDSSSYSSSCSSHSLSDSGNSYSSSSSCD